MIGDRGMMSEGSVELVEVVELVQPEIEGIKPWPFSSEQWHFGHDLRQARVVLKPSKP